MSAKLTDLKCPHCGGNIELKQGQKILYCPYCGAQLYFDDGVKRSEKTVNINNYDEKSRIAFEREKYEDDKLRKFFIFAFLAFMIILAMVVITWAIGRA